MTDDTTASTPPPERSSQGAEAAPDARPALPTFGPTVDPSASPTPLAPEAEPPDPRVARIRQRWDGRKTAVVAGLAVVLTSAGAIGAAAALPSGTTLGEESGGRFRGGVPGGQPPGQFQRGGTGQNGTSPRAVVPNGTGGQGQAATPQDGSQLPGLGQAPGGSTPTDPADPNDPQSSLLGQVAPDLLAELDQVNPTLATQLERLLRSGRLAPSDLARLERLDPSRLAQLGLRGGSSGGGGAAPDQQGQPDGSGSATETSLRTT